MGHDKCSGLKAVHQTSGRAETWSAGVFCLQQGGQTAAREPHWALLGLVYVSETTNDALSDARSVK